MTRCVCLQSICVAESEFLCTGVHQSESKRVPLRAERRDRQTGSLALQKLAQCMPLTCQPLQTEQSKRLLCCYMMLFKRDGCSATECTGDLGYTVVPQLEIILLCSSLAASLYYVSAFEFVNIDGINSILIRHVYTAY